MPSPVAAVPAAAPSHALARFESSLAFETDCWDVHHSLATGQADFVLLDVRGPEAFAAGHVPGAIHLPHGKIVESRLRDYPGNTLFVAYCAGPHCNGATRAAIRLASLGRPVKIMIGGVTGWLDEGFALTPPASAQAVIGTAPDTASSPLPAMLAAVELYFQALHECDLGKFDQVFHPAASLFDSLDGRVTAMPVAPITGNSTPQPTAWKLGRSTIITPTKATTVASHAAGRAGSRRNMIASTAVMIGWVNAMVVASASGMILVNLRNARSDVCSMCRM